MITPPHVILKDKATSKAYLIIVFLLWPVVGLLLACANFKDRLSKRIILAFMVLFGLLLFINPVMDSERRAAKLIELRLQSVEVLYDHFETLYEETLDIAEITIMFVVSRVSDFHGVLFGVYAFLFGTLMLYYLSTMYNHFANNRNLNTLLFFVLLICVNPINNIGGFRMWMAAWVFAVGVLLYLKDNSNYLSILVAASAILIHFSFLPTLAIVGLYILFRNNALVYGVIALATFTLAELDIAQVREYAALFGPASETKITSYTHDGHVEKVAELSTQSAWYITLINNGIKYFILVSLLMVYLKTKGNFKEKITANFYSFSLLFLSFANITSLLPSGGRFYIVFYIFAVATLLLYYIYEVEENRITLINKIGIPFVGLYAILTFRLFSDSASAYLLAPSFMMPLAFIENISLRSLIF